jgi:hypothetical protein
MPTATKTPARKPAAPKAPAKRTTKVSKYEPHPLRLRMYSARVDENTEITDYEKATPPVLPTGEHPANLVSSLCTDGQHRLVIDLDVPAHLEPSTTPGNSHLYIDVPMGWRTYSRLLDALAAASIIEYGYNRASQRQNQTFVRLPGVKKPEAQMKRVKHFTGEDLW